MTYTKAPWHICEVTGRNLKLIRDENGYCVAEAVKPANSGAAYIDADANAALIAAAPEMLAALELMNELFADHAQYDDEGFETAAIVAAQAAIAKARGEVA
jgi:hypothetical protein